MEGGHSSIGELAKEAGVKVVTIRYYEKIGVFPSPARTGCNYRTYTREHARQLHFIRRCRDLGFSLRQVRDLLRLSSENTASCAEVCHIAERHLRAVEEKVVDLERLAAELRNLTSSCNGSRPMVKCRIIEALSQ